VAVCLIAIIVPNAHAIDRQLRDWKLLPEPERLTELYFTAPNNLPNSYSPGESQTVNFTVHNLEYQTTAYHYLIIEQSQDGSQSQTLAGGSFTLAQNQYDRPSVKIFLPNLGSRVKVEIELTNVHESIDYWVEQT
jgi:hypothetical protein